SGLSWGKTGLRIAGFVVSNVHDHRAIICAFLIVEEAPVLGTPPIHARNSPPGRMVFLTTIQEGDHFGPLRAFLWTLGARLEAAAKPGNSRRRSSRTKAPAGIVQILIPRIWFSFDRIIPHAEFGTRISFKMAIGPVAT